MPELNLEQERQDVRRLFERGFLTALEHDSRLSELNETIIRADIAKGQGFIQMTQDAIRRRLQDAKQLFFRGLEQVRLAPEPREGEEQDPIARFREGLGGVTLSFLAVLQGINSVTEVFNVAGEMAGEAIRNRESQTPLSRELRDADANAIADLLEIGPELIIQALMSIPERMMVQGAQQAFDVAKGTTKKVPKALETILNFNPEEAKKAERGIELLGELARNNGMKDEAENLVSSLKKGLRESVTITEMPETPTTRNLLENFRTALAQQRRGTMPENLIERRGAELAKDAEFLRALATAPPGSPFQAEEVSAAVQAVSPRLEEVVRLARRLRAGDETVVRDVDNLLADTSIFLRNTLGGQAEAGRSLAIVNKGQFFREFAGMLNRRFPVGMSDEGLEKMKIAFYKELAELALPGEPGSKQDMQALTRMVRRGYAAGFEEFWKNMLLMSPLTQARNVLGTGMMIGAGITRMKLASEFGKHIDPEEVAVWTHAFNSSIFENIGRHFRGVFNEKQFNEIAGVMDSTRFGVADTFGAIPGLTGKIVRTPARSMVMMDKLARDSIEFAHIKAAAYKKLVGDGLKPGTRDFELAMDAFVTEPPRGVVDAAKRLSAELTFTDPFPDHIQKTIQGFDRKGGFLFIPFTRTLVRLLQASRDFTPMAQLTSKRLRMMIREGGRARDEAQAQIAMANVFGHVMWNWAIQGTLTGGGPVDPKMREIWEDLGNKPYHFMNRIPFRDLEPFGTIMGIMADLATGAPTTTDAEAEQLFGAVMMTMVRAVQNNAWWQGILNLGKVEAEIRAGRPTGEVLGKALLSPLVTLGSGGPIGTQLTRELDPFLRESRGIWDDWKRRVPGLSTEVPHDYNVLGDKTLRPPGIGAPLLNQVLPLGTYPKTKDPELAILQDLNISVKKWPPDTILGDRRPASVFAKDDPSRAFGPNIENLRTPEGKWFKDELGEMMSTFKLPLELTMDSINLPGMPGFSLPERDRTLRESIRDIAADPEFDRMNRSQQTLILESVISNYRTALIEHYAVNVRPQLIREWARNLAEAKSHLVGGTAKAELDQQLQEALELIDQGRVPGDLNRLEDVR